MEGLIAIGVIATAIPIGFAVHLAWSRFIDRAAAPVRLGYLGGTRSATFRDGTRAAYLIAGFDSGWYTASGRRVGWWGRTLIDAAEQREYQARREREVQQRLANAFPPEPVEPVGYRDPAKAGGSEAAS